MIVRSLLAKARPGLKRLLILALAFAVLAALVTHIRARARDWCSAGRQASETGGRKTGTHKPMLSRRSFAKSFRPLPRSEGPGRPATCPRSASEMQPKIESSVGLAGCRTPQSPGRVKARPAAEATVFTPLKRAKLIRGGPVLRAPWHTLYGLSIFPRVALSRVKPVWPGSMRRHPS